MAAAFDTEHATFGDAVKAMEARMVELNGRPWCGICGATVLTFEDRATKFVSLETAMPVLKLAEADNLATRKRLDAAGESYDAKLKQ